MAVSRQLLALKALIAPLNLKLKCHAQRVLGQTQKCSSPKTSADHVQRATPVTSQVLLAWKVLNAQKDLTAQVTQTQTCAQQEHTETAQEVRLMRIARPAL